MRNKKVILGIGIILILLLSNISLGEEEEKKSWLDKGKEKVKEVIGKTTKKPPTEASTTRAPAKPKDEKLYEKINREYVKELIPLIVKANNKKPPWEDGEDFLKFYQEKDAMMDEIIKLTRSIRVTIQNDLKVNFENYNRIHKECEKVEKDVEEIKERIKKFSERDIQDGSRNGVITGGKRFSRDDRYEYKKIRIPPEIKLDGSEKRVEGVLGKALGWIEGVLGKALGWIPGVGKLFKKGLGEGECFQAIKEMTGGKRDPELIQKACKIIEEKYSDNPCLIIGQIYQESGFDPYQVSYRGAAGILQIIPPTAKALGLTKIYKLNEYPADNEGREDYAKKLEKAIEGLSEEEMKALDERFDAEKNLNAGIAHFIQLMNEFGDEELALAAYNWGPGRAGERKTKVRAIADEYKKAKKIIEENEDKSDRRAYTAYLFEHNEELRKAKSTLGRLKRGMPKETREYIPAVLKHEKKCKELTGQAESSGVAGVVGDAFGLVWKFKTGVIAILIGLLLISMVFGVVRHPIKTAEGVIKFIGKILSPIPRMFRCFALMCETRIISAEELDGLKKLLATLKGKIGVFLRLFFTSKKKLEKIMEMDDITTDSIKNVKIKKERVKERRELNERVKEMISENKRLTRIADEIMKELKKLHRQKRISKSELKKHEKTLRRTKEKIEEEIRSLIKREVELEKDLVEIEENLKKANRGEIRTRPEYLRNEKRETEKDIAEVRQKIKDLSEKAGEEEEILTKITGMERRVQESEDEIKDLFKKSITEEEEIRQMFEKEKVETKGETKGEGQSERLKTIAEAERDLSDLHGDRQLITEEEFEKASAILQRCRKEAEKEAEEIKEKEDEREGLIRRRKAIQSDFEIKGKHGKLYSDMDKMEEKNEEKIRKIEQEIKNLEQIKGDEQNVIERIAEIKEIDGMFK